MTESPLISSRKSDHIRINLEQNVGSGMTTGLEKYHFVHNAIPELDYEEVDLKQVFFGRELKSPLLISSMTGGTAAAEKINLILAEAAQETRIAMGVGSQRAAIEEPALMKSFQVRKRAPDILLFANLGAVQLNYRYSLKECEQAVEMIQADALILHFNALQEAVQPEGDKNFSGLLRKIEAVCRNISVPVIAKEVGWGFSEDNCRQLADVGIAAIDVAGAGGTSWSQVEMYRAENPSQARLAGAFIEWGIPTSEAILNVRNGAPGVKIIASGGIRTGMDIAKCIALGASMGGMAGPFLKAANQSLEDTIQVIEELTEVIKVCMFVSGAATINQLQQTHLLER